MVGFSNRKKFWKRKKFNKKNQTIGKKKKKDTAAVPTLVAAELLKKALKQKRFR